LVSLEGGKSYKFSSLSKESEIEPALPGSPSLVLSLRSKPGRRGCQEVKGCSRREGRTFADTNEKIASKFLELFKKL
jgi:hypothetical protein